MLAVFLSLLAVAVAEARAPEPGRESGESVESMLHPESAEVFLAKATLQQYLERVMRQDWRGVRSLTHPKALAAIAARRNRGESTDLAPWDIDDELVRFALKGARSAAPGIVLIEVTERGESATYVLFKSHGSWLVGAKEFGAHLDDVSDESVRARYPGWVDHQALTQARRAERTARRAERVGQRHR
ncbi:MAG TPA: hypothetical protein VG496_19330 [Myxococcales bacterium]|nr:hypothetical protein [Myxococcales bacterium]